MLYIWIDNCEARFLCVHALVDLLPLINTLVKRCDVSNVVPRVYLQRFSVLDFVVGCHRRKCLRFSKRSLKKFMAMMLLLVTYSAATFVIHQCEAPGSTKFLIQPYWKKGVLEILRRVCCKDFRCLYADHAYRSLTWTSTLLRGFVGSAFELIAGVHHEGTFSLAFGCSWVDWCFFWGF